MKIGKWRNCLSSFFIPDRLKLNIIPSVVKMGYYLVAVATARHLPLALGERFCVHTPSSQQALPPPPRKQAVALEKDQDVR